MLAQIIPSNFIWAVLAIEYLIKYSVKVLCFFCFLIHFKSVDFKQLETSVTVAANMLLKNPSVLSHPVK